MLIISHLLLARRITPVGMLAGDLVKHLHKVHVDARVPLNELLEFADRGREGLGLVGVDVGGYFVEVGMVDAVVGWEPGTGSGMR